MSVLESNTRFNPTVNGGIHVGHLYMALVNEAEAHANRGKFIVRFEDNQKEWVLRTPADKVQEIEQGILQDLDWMGIKYDKVEYQSKLQDEYHKFLSFVCPGGLVVRERTIFEHQPDVTYTNATAYPYAAHLTAEKVIMDWMDKITLLIRGEDLLSEFSLYSYFCDLWGITNPKHVYIPRLRMNDGSELQTEISKATGNYKIAGYRERGYSADELRNNLEDACLIDPKGGWLIKNIKARPIWNG